MVDIRDVAASAGVSVSTVSNALNKPELVSRSAAAKVAEAIDRLDYVPNIAARQLRAGRSNAIGMAVMNIANPFFSALVLGAEEVAERAGYSVIVGNSNDSPARQARHLELFDRQRLDGVLLSAVGEVDELLVRFRKRKVPVVLVDRVDPHGTVPSVSLDDVLGGRIATEHLIAGGSKRLMFLGGPFQVQQVFDRFAGFKAAAAENDVRLTTFELDTMNPRVGRELGEKLAAMPSGDRPDGIFAANDELALGVMQSLLRNGIRVPEEISIVGYDDIDFAAAAIVPLTSVRQPATEIGNRAMELLLDELTDGSADRGSEPALVRFEPQLVIRQSSTTRN